MGIYNIKLGHLSGDTIIEKNKNLSFKKFNNLSNDFKKYNNKMSSDIEKMLIKDFEEIEKHIFDTNIKNDFKILLDLTRKYPIYYWNITEIEYIKENIIISDNITKIDENNGGYYFIFNINNINKKISTYTEALQLHIELLELGNYKMAELLYQIANKMTDNPKELYKKIEYI